MLSELAPVKSDFTDTGCAPNLSGGRQVKVRDVTALDPTRSGSYPRGMTELSFDLPRLDLGLSDFAGAYDLVLCDVWGVIHNGVAFHQEAVDALRRFRAGGGSVVLITNAPVPQAQVQARLHGLRVPRDAYDAIATSGDVTVAKMVAAGCPPVFNIGPGDELLLYQEAERLGPRKPELAPIEQAELAICIGLDEVRPRPEDYDAILSALRARRVDLVCANPDIVVEVGDSLVFCAGAIAERYAAIGGTVIHAGKPFPAIYERALSMAPPTATERILAIGDAIHTDMQGARDQGFSALLVTGGIHRAELHADGRRDEPISAAALGRLLERQKARPTAALAGLRW